MPASVSREPRPFRQDSSTCKSYAGFSGSPATSSPRREAALEPLRKELRSLEEERDVAVSTAESCARTCVRLTDMSKLLEDLALEKLKTGDEAGARMVLQEKNSLRDIIDKSNAKAQTNFALAGKLATKIGEKHSELLALMGGGAGGPEADAAASSGSGAGGFRSSVSGGSGGSSGVGGGVTSWPEPSTSAPASGEYGSEGASASYGTGGGVGSAGGGGGYQMPWERSLSEAQQRVRQAEAEAQSMGRLAKLSADESIAAARERLAGRRRGPGAGSSESILQARERLRRAAEASIAEARERLRSQDAAVLEYCRRIVARYRRGEYVAEEELEFAFEQLERRLL